MMALTRFLIGLIAIFVCSSLASLVHYRDADALVQTVYHFSNETVSYTRKSQDAAANHPCLSQWVENIAVRSNGKILVTLINKPQVWQIDTARKSAELVHEFSDAISAMGIAEYGNDVFAVVSGLHCLRVADNH
jgi:hypothetical protein